ncbi:MAG: Stp1/IreP family PP2C-type Ser/Thr phosphatase [Oscillospiraceae bacterium]|nr:Stp1/IreP family PP2C-type Ser/Thr phosphatase [Oscillospiraceae bacterium]
MKSFGLTDKGTVRSENQDSFLLELYPEKGLTIAVLCDGMGGERAGGLASRLSDRAFATCVFERLRSSSGKTYDLEAIMRGACAEANGVAYEYSRFGEEYRGMGTTIVGAVIKRSGSGYIINVGDSRAYLISPLRKSIRQVTRDHSLVEELVRFGAISREDAKTHPQRNVITRALGSEESVFADLFPVKIGIGEILLLCSDGLSNTVEDREILETARKHRDPEELCRRLMDLALLRGARDNVTVIALRR